MTIEHVTIGMPTAKDRQHAAAYLRHLADRIGAEEDEQRPAPRLKLDSAQVEIHQELLDPIEIDAFPIQRIVQRHVGEAMTLRLHWGMA